MGYKRVEHGFTITEVIVTLGVLSLFVILLFQLYTMNVSQSRSTMLYAAANDIAQSNLRKISAKNFIPPATTACDDTTDGAGNPNNGAKNSALNPDPTTNVDPATGSEISWSSSLTPESINNTTLPSSTTQELRVVYPVGCNPNMPARILSIVTYGTESSQKVVRSEYVN